MGWNVDKLPPGRLTACCGFMGRISITVSVWQVGLSAPTDVAYRRSLTVAWLQGFYAQGVTSGIRELMEEPAAKEAGRRHFIIPLSSDAMRQPET